MSNLSLAAVAANRRTIEVDLGLPETLTVTYRVNVMTPADELAFKRYAGKTEFAEEEMEAFIAFVCRFVAEWGLVGPLTAADGTEIVAEGEPVPITPEAMRQMPSLVMSRVFMAGLADLADPKGSTRNGG